jgi:hypothetical protein
MNTKEWAHVACPACKRTYETHEQSPPGEPVTRLVCHDGTVVYRCRTCELVMNRHGHHLCREA